MAKIISQKTIFDYSEIEKKGDLERLEICIEGIDDSRLVEKLEKERGKGRDDYPISVMLNLFYAMKIFGHKSVNSFIREADRNSQMRKMCGLNDFSNKKKHLVPPPRVFTGFIKKLTKNIEELDKIFDELQDYMYEHVESYGEVGAGDGKIISSHSNRPKKEILEKDLGDARCETDAEFTTKVYHYTDASGVEKEKKTTHYGFRAHVICDVKTELPMAVEVTKANFDEKKMMIKMLKEMKQERKEKLKYMLLDRGYDSTKMINTIIDTGAIPIVDKRNMWQDNEATKQYKDTDIVYDVSGNVYYVDDAGELNEMSYKGYDKDRDALRYEYQGKIYRILRSENERIFNPVARPSKKFKRIYKGRTSVERYNGRLDRDYMFEDHFIRGLKKMEMMVKFSSIIMLAMAKGHIEAGRKNLASLVNIKSA